MKDPSKHAKHVLVLLAATALAARDKICHPGQGGLFLPFFGDSEQELSTAAEWGRGFLYFRAFGLGKPVDSRRVQSDLHYL